MYEIISKKKTKVIIGLIRIPKLIKFIEIHITATTFFCEFFFFNLQQRLNQGLIEKEQKNLKLQLVFFDLLKDILLF